MLQFLNVVADLTEMSAKQLISILSLARDTHFSLSVNVFQCFSVRKFHGKFAGQLKMLRAHVIFLHVYPSVLL